MNDLIKEIQAVLYFAWSDTRSRYKRSVLGPLWLSLGTGLTVIGLGIIWGGMLNNQAIDYIPSLAAGLIVWQFISGCLIESATVFKANSAIIKNINLPYSLYVMKCVAKNLVGLFHNSLVFVLVLIFFGILPSAPYVYAIPGVLLLICNVVWITFLCGMLGARFKDFEFAIQSMMPLLFFITPVMYKMSNVPYGSEIMWANPFTYMIEIVREPLLGVVPDVRLYVVNIAFLTIGSAISIIFYRARSKYIPFWL